MSNPTPALVTALGAMVSGLRALGGNYGSPDTTATVSVFDGPPLAMDAPQSYVAVGWNPNGGDEAGRFLADPGPFGARADRLEEGSFEVTVVARNGDGDASSARAALVAIYEDVSATAYGLTDATFAAWWCRAESVIVRQNQDTYGCTVTAEATFAYRCQLT